MLHSRLSCPDVPALQSRNLKPISFCEGREGKGRGRGSTHECQPVFQLQHFLHIGSIVWWLASVSDFAHQNIALLNLVARERKVLLKIWKVGAWRCC